MYLLESFSAAKQDCKAILLPMILYVFSARCYIPPLCISPPLSHTHINYLHSASPPDWSVRSRLLAKEKETTRKGRGIRDTAKHIYSPLLAWQSEPLKVNVGMNGTDYREKLHKLITAVAPGVVYEKYQLPLKEMKYKTLLMNPNGLPFP